MDVADITDEQIVEAFNAALLDAGLEYLREVPGEPHVVDIEGYLDLRKVAQHFRRRVTAEPVVETEAPE